MNLLILLTFLTLLVAAYGEVHQLTARNWNEKVKGDYLVKFYAPWCGHCRRMQPMYEELSTNLSTSKTGVGKVDGTQERGLSAVFSITGFPTIYYIGPDNNSVYEYKGRRSVEAMVEYVNGGYEKDEPLSFWTGPFGMVGSLKWFMLWLGNKVWGVYEMLEPYLGRWIAGAVVGFGGMIAMSVVIVGFMVWITKQTQEVKRD